jgi:hypothetical protein
VKELMLKSAPVAVLLVVLVLLFAFHALPPKNATGYSIRLAPAHCPLQDDSDADRLIILRIIYGARMHRTLYVAAEDEVPYQKVADAIDIVTNTYSSASKPGENLGIAVKLMTPAALNALCPQLVKVSRRDLSAR